MSFASLISGLLSKTGQNFRNFPGQNFRNRPLSKATLYSTLNALRRFFLWLADQPGFRARIRYSDAEYFNLSEKETRIATAHRERPVPTLEQIEHTVRLMPSNSDIERRDRAIIAFAILTGARDGAIASFKLKHIDIAGKVVRQDAREVHTKFSKTFDTSFFPVGEPFEQIVVEWVDYLRKDRLWGLDDPLFPATRVEQHASRWFVVRGIDRKHWSSAAPIREVFKAAFARVGLPYFNPHSFRKTLARLGQHLCKLPEDFKAWSQNLGHEQMLTTFVSYGALPRHQQAEIIRSLGKPRDTERPDPAEFAKAVVREMRASQGRQG